jgi:bacillithiol system protein YtxJ
MDWKYLDTEEEIDKIISQSNNRNILVFKHSLTCPISAGTLQDLETEWQKEEMQKVDTYLLPIQNYRNLSKAVAEAFGVRHESPQVLVISNGICAYHNSHWKINYQSLKPVLLPGA